MNINSDILQVLIPYYKCMFRSQIFYTGLSDGLKIDTYSGELKHIVSTTQKF